MNSQELDDSDDPPGEPVSYDDLISDFEPFIPPEAPMVTTNSASDPGTDPEKIDNRFLSTQAQ